MKKMSRVRYGFIAVVLLFILSCSQQSVSPFGDRLSQGDSHVNWALAYFESWKLSHQPRYLFLVRDHTVQAIDTFYDLQQDTSPAIKEFFIVRERRVRSCQMLQDVQVEASNFGYPIDPDAPNQCSAM